MPPTSIKKSVEKATLMVTIASTVVAVATAGAAFWSGYEARNTRLDNERPFLSIDPQNCDGDDLSRGVCRRLASSHPNVTAVSRDHLLHIAQCGDTRVLPDLK